MIRSKFSFLGICFTVLISSCGNQQYEMTECVGFQIKGWGELLKKEAFSSLDHRKQTQLDPLTERSELSFADANYVYDRILTFTLLYPKDAKGRFSHVNSCVSEASLIVRSPGDNLSLETLSAFLEFLEENSIAPKIILDVHSVFDATEIFSVLDKTLMTEVGAGFIEHVRGKFFVVRIKSLDPFAERLRQELPK